jgi:hypothetical protein
VSESRRPVNLTSLLDAETATGGAFSRAILDTLTGNPPLKDLELVETNEEIWIERKRTGEVLVRAEKVL